jgi:hypothetical protein
MSPALKDQLLGYSIGKAVNLSALAQAAIFYSPMQEQPKWHFVDGAEWQRQQIFPDFKFILEALPNEHRIADLQLRAEIDLVRSKLNEIISKLQ